MVCVFSLFSNFILLFLLTFLQLFNRYSHVWYCTIIYFSRKNYARCETLFTFLFLLLSIHNRIFQKKTLRSFVNSIRNCSNQWLRWTKPFHKLATQYMNIFFSAPFRSVEWYAKTTERMSGTDWERESERISGRALRYKHCVNVNVRFSVDEQQI